MFVRTLVLGASSLLLAGCGITGNFRNDPGYADFGSLQRLDSESDFGISLVCRLIANVSLRRIGTFLRGARGPPRVGESRRPSRGNRQLRRRSSPRTTGQGSPITVSGHRQEPDESW
jgi:hypothetical protein